MDRCLRLPAAVLVLLLALAGCQTLPNWMSFDEPDSVIDLPADASAEQLYQSAVLLLRDAKYKPANSLLQRAAQLEHPGAQYLLGLNRLSGQGIARDESLAHYWLEQAAQSGYAKAQYYVGELYLNGRGIPAEKGWGVQWLERAASRGNHSAQLAVGVALASGLGGVRDDQAALLWLLRAQQGLRQQGKPSTQADQLLKRLRHRIEDSRWRQLTALAQQALPALRKPERGTVRFVQLSLNHAGFDAGEADGLMGPRTRSALQRFREQQKLAGKGVNAALLNELRFRQRQYELTRKGLSYRPEVQVLALAR